MDDTTALALRIAQGPVFRFGLALALLGLARLALLALSDLTAAWVTDANRSVVWRKVRQHVGWQLFPSLVLHAARPFRSRGLYAYHVALDAVSLVFRTLVVLLPIFLVAHVYLWERALGVSWPALPGAIADVLSIVALVSGAAVFLGRIYSPVLRKLEPTWSFFTPPLLLLPFLTGILTRHPTWSPLDYHFVLLIHVLSAAAVLALLPFARLLSSLQVRLTTILPQAAWQPESPPAQAAGVSGA
ncbi:MAG: hypothetical protein IPM13_08030 [Phycisphaerales bacterium]|nr:hypothetical protein [Phycisphaerales bacterium]